MRSLTIAVLLASVVNATALTADAISREERKIPRVSHHWMVYPDQDLKWKSGERYRTIDAFKLRIDGKLPFEEWHGCHSFYSRRGLVVHISFCAKERAFLRVVARSVRAKPARVRLSYLATR